MIFGYITLAVAFILSAVAAYYSVLGLTAIFSAAFWPVVIMGTALEVGKVITAMWLHQNWHRSTWIYKAYLLPSLLFLMLLTSMGTFGFLSRAHSDQGQATGDAQAQLVIFDERIKTERENIDAARRALNQLDQTVDQTIARSTAEDSVVRAANIRRAQQRERQALQRDIANAQSNIVRLNEQRAPIAAQYRKIEAEVGPIKYVAALIYGDNPDKNLLERAVRWVIILIVAVFDPLAVVLILAGAKHLEWSRKELKYTTDQIIEKNVVTIPPEPNITTNTIDTITPTVDINAVAVNTTVEDEFNINNYPYLFNPIIHHAPGNLRVAPLVYKEPEQVHIPEDSIEIDTELTTTSKAVLPAFKKINDDYYEIDGKMMHIRVIKELMPAIYSVILEQNLKPQADNLPEPVRATFGIEFPKNPVRGEMFLQVSTLPSKLYKYNGKQWISVDKNTADSYTYDSEYLKFLIDRMAAGVITPDDLTVSEQEQVSEYLKNAK